MLSMLRRLLFYKGHVERTVGISTYALSKSLLLRVQTGSSDDTQRVRGTFLQTTDALAHAGAVSCLERSAVHDTRAYYLLFRADCDLSEHMAGRSGSLE
jgi:hypothetical protein